MPPDLHRGDRPQIGLGTDWMNDHADVGLPWVLECVMIPSRASLPLLGLPCTDFVPAFRDAPLDLSQRHCNSQAYTCYAQLASFTVPFHPHA